MACRAPITYLFSLPTLPSCSEKCSIPFSFNFFFSLQILSKIWACFPGHYGLCHYFSRAETPLSRTHAAVCLPTGSLLASILSQSAFVKACLSLFPYSVSVLWGTAEIYMLPVLFFSQTNKTVLIPSLFPNSLLAD